MPKRAKTRRKKRGIFFPPKHKKWAEIIRIDSPKNAKKAAETMLRLFKKAERRDYKRKIKSAVVLAANRAKAMLRRKNLSAKERREMERVARIYMNVAKKMKLR